MDAKRINWVQNTAIFLLSLSAVVLFVQTQLYNLGGDAQSVWAALVVSTDNNSGAQLTQSNLSAPVGVAVSTSFGRTGTPQCSTEDESFVPLGSILSEALGALGVVESITQVQFQAGLSSPCVYYEFYIPLPTTVLAQGLLGGALPMVEGTMRRIILAQDDDGTTTLSWWDGAEGFFRCSTTVSQVALRSLLESDWGEAVFFAFEGQQLTQGLGNLDPLSLFVAGDVLYPELSVYTSLEDSGTLLSKLGFNPHTNYRYAESNGTEVVMEDERSLRLYPNGSITYRNDGQDSDLEVSAVDGSMPTLVEASLGVGQLLQSLLGDGAGDGMLYLQSIVQDQGETTLTFDYQVGGVPVLRANGESAATVVLTGRTITSLTLQLRQYTQAETPSLLLPLAQAAAIAQETGHLRLAYVDNGSDVIAAGWVSLEE